MPKGEEKYQAVLDEVQRAYNKKQPVMGRILNTLNGGYAIGIAGVVGFCPFKLCTLQTASRVGLLQPFLVNSFRQEPFNLILEDVHAPEKAAQAFKPPLKAWPATPATQAPTPNLAPGSTAASSTHHRAFVEQSELKAGDKEADALMRQSNMSHLAEPQNADQRPVDPGPKR